MLGAVQSFGSDINACFSVAQGFKAVVSLLKTFRSRQRSFQSIVMYSMRFMNRLLDLSIATFLYFWHEGFVISYDTIFFFKNLVVQFDKQMVSFDTGNVLFLSNTMSAVVHHVRLLYILLIVRWMQSKVKYWLLIFTNVCLHFFPKQFASIFWKAWNYMIIRLLSSYFEMLAEKHCVSHFSRNFR